MNSAKTEILMIEDDAAEAALIRDMLADLRRESFSVQHVHYLAEGLELLQSRSFDCVLVDLGLPDSRGLESALSVRRAASEVPIVVLTVLNDEETALNALEMDIQDYLVKGEINGAVLVRTIRYAIHRKALSRQLSDSEARLRFAAEASGVGMWHWNLVRDELTWSEKTKELCGYPREFEASYGAFFDAVHPEDRERVDQAIRKALREGTDYSAEMRVLLPSGEPRWLLAKGRAVYDEHHKPLRMDGILLDLTQRKEAEDALRASERKFSKIFEATPALLFISTLNEGLIVDVNETALQTLGYQRREIVGHLGNELKIWHDPLDRQKIVETLKTGGSVRDYALKIRRKNGEILECLFFAELLAIDGVPHILSLLRDITAQKRGEEALIQAKEEWERTFDSVPDLVAIIDRNNRIVRLNRAMAEKMGKRPQDCLGLTCYAALHGTERPPESCPHLKVLAQLRQEIAEMEVLGAHYLVSYTPLLSPDGAPLGVVHVARDITERKRAEEQIGRLNAELAARAAELEAANRELEAFSYTAAHDLRQPLNVISGYCQAVELICGDALAKECQEYLQGTYQGVRRMTNLIDSLLMFSRTSRKELHRERVDLSEIAHAAATDLKLAHPERPVDFRIAEGVQAHADAGLLRTVLDNLLGNAWKYTSRQPHPLIEFGITRIEGCEAYFVRDNGQGFDMVDADKLFTPFQRLAEAEINTGFGIGLATVERIVGRHGGKIWAQGEPGTGATFYFTLPQSRETDEGPC